MFVRIIISPVIFAMLGFTLLAMWPAVIILSMCMFYSCDDMEDVKMAFQYLFMPIHAPFWMTWLFIKEGITID